jgi:hypothetical protein
MPIGEAGSTDRGPGRAVLGARSAQAADQDRSGPQLAHRHRERSAEPLPDTLQARHPGLPAPDLTWGFVWQVLGSNQRRLSRQGAHCLPSLWPLTCGYSIPCRVKIAFCPCGVRGPGVCLVSATHLLDHVP